MRVAIVAYATRRESIEALLWATYALDVLYLRTNRTTPVYQAGIFWTNEPLVISEDEDGDAGDTEERFNTVPRVMALGWGDCDDLATWRAAELTLQGIEARPKLKRVGPGQWHVVVELPDGSEEDPSAMLGMMRGRAVAVAGRRR